MKTWYKDLKGRFSEFPKHVQILHLVSDLKKAKNLAVSHPSSSTNHLYRAIILLDYIIQDSKWKSALHELLRLREAVGSVLFLSPPYASIEQLISAAVQMEPQAYRIYKNV